MLFLPHRGTQDSESTPPAGRVNNGWSSVSAGGDGDYSCGGVSQVLQNVPVIYSASGVHVLMFRVLSCGSKRRESPYSNRLQRYISNRGESHQSLTVK